jgi:hypothetical protein
MQAGFYFIATGKRFLSEACLSARRIREVMPGVPVAVATDLEPAEGLFDDVIRIDGPDHSFADKVRFLPRSPYGKTVFLDTDTWLCRPVPELFLEGERWDIAMAHAPIRYTAASRTPGILPEFNSGLISFRLNSRTEALFSMWRRFYDERLESTGVKDDQPSLRDALWQSEARVLVLPPEYNFRFVMPSFAGRGAVKILHGRHDDYAGLAARLNRSGSPRVFLPRIREADARHFGILSLPGRILASFVSWDAWCAAWSGAALDGIRSRFARKP